MRFTVKEIHNGYVLVDTVTGQERHIGDGVDLFEGIAPGTTGFILAAENMFNSCVEEMVEAYNFGLQKEKE